MLGERTVLEVAACCGFDFDPVLIGDVLDVPRIPLLQRLARIEKAHGSVRSAGRRYVFDHQLVQEVLYDGLHELLWLPVEEDVDGVDRPGHVVHRHGGTDTAVATKVPMGGFAVRLRGGTLVIRGTAYYTTSDGRVAQVTGTTAVALRN